MPRYRRHFLPRQTVFLTLVCHERRPWLAADKAKQRVLESLRAVRQLHPFRHHGYVLLHDHLHLLLSPIGDAGIPRLVGSFKYGVRMRVREPRRLWQSRYYDHIIRDADDFARHLDYLHFNPVKHGLVSRAGDWAWSSLATWIARGAYSDDWGMADAGDMQVGE